MTTFAIHPEQYQKTQFVVNKRTLYALQSHSQVNGSPYFITQAQQYRIRPQKHNSISMLYQINTPGYQLRHPLMIEFEPDEDGAVIATSPESNAYGVGESEQEAADDFIGMLIDIFEELKNSESILSSALLRQFRKLETILISA